MQWPPWLRDMLGTVSPEYVIFHNTVARWLIAAGAFLVAVLVLQLLKSLLARRFEALAKYTAADWCEAAGEALRATRSSFLLIISLFLASLLLTLPPKAMLVLRALAVIALLVQSAFWGTLLVDFFIARQMKKRLATDASGVTMMTALGFVGKLVLYAVVALLILENVGIDVTALVAGLGIGGIAVALAAQNILGDLFASLSIVLDKPFVLGDFIIVGDSMGTVERIGLKTTRLRSLSGEQLVFSNNDLLQSRIRNFKRMQERRVLFTIGVTYQTPREKLTEIPAILQAAVQQHENARFDRAHFKEFGASSLVFEVVYFVLSPQFGVYMDIQQAINLNLYQRFGELGIEFAYPTQTLYLQRQAAPAKDDVS